MLSVFIAFLPFWLFQAFAGFTAMLSEPLLPGQELTPKVRALLLPVPECQAPAPRKGKKIASSADGGADSRVPDDGAMLGDVSPLPCREVGETVDVVAHEGLVDPPLTEEVAVRAPTKGGPPLAAPEAPAIHQPHGGLTSPQLRVPLAMLVAKRQKLMALMKYVDSVFMLLFCLQRLLRTNQRSRPQVL